jgi:GH24 family phage-related lysozyme (muramidase)
MTAEQSQSLLTAAKPIIEAAEGRVPHFYLDGKRNVTVGCGHKVLHAQDALASDMQPESYRTLDFSRVAIAPSGYKADWYGTICKSRMSDPAIDALLAEDSRRFIFQLNVWLPQFADYPLSAQEAMLDMAYNLGIAGFLGYHNLIAAANRGDWVAAARESFRHGLGDTPDKPGERNARTAELFQNAGQA